MQPLGVPVYDVETNKLSVTAKRYNQARAYFKVGRLLSVVMLSVVMLSAVMLSVMLSVMLL